MPDYLRGKQVYLSYPMEFSHLYGDDWKHPVIQELIDRFGLIVADAAQEEKQKYLPLLTKALDDGDFDAAEFVSKKFVKKDLALIEKSDFMILFNPKGIPTTGCPCELHHASNTLKKPVMIVVPEGKKFVSKWYLGYIKHRYIYSNWEQLYEYLEEVNKAMHIDNHRWWHVYGVV